MLQLLAIAAAHLTVSLSTQAAFSRGSITTRTKTQANLPDAFLATTGQVPTETGNARTHRGIIFGMFMPKIQIKPQPIVHNSMQVVTHVRLVALN